MSLLRECPFCGAALDPGERCDCREAEALSAVRTGDPSATGWAGRYEQPTMIQPGEKSLFVGAERGAGMKWHETRLADRLSALREKENAGSGAGTPEPAKADD